MKVLIATDGSPESSLAIDAAAGLSWPEGSTIDVLTVLPSDAELFGNPWTDVAYVQTHQAAGAETDELRMHLRDGARTVLAESVAILRKDGVSVVATIGEGRAASVIVDTAHATGADLIILGARGQGALERVLLGSVSAEVVDQAHCAVLVARHEWTRRVLIGTDGSDQATGAVEFVARSGLFCGSEIGVLQVVDLHPDWWLGYTTGNASFAPSSFVSVVEDARRHATKTTTDGIERLRAEGLVATALVREGSAAPAIVDGAARWGADLIVVGTRGHGLLKRMLVGSTARSVLHHAGTSVLVTRGAATSIGSSSVRASEVPTVAARS